MLTFGPATWNVEQTVTVAAELDDDTASESATITHTVSGYGDVTTAAPVSVVVNDVNGVPAFQATVTDQIYTERVPIPTLTLPGAAGGDGALSYTLAGPLPDGLTFVPASNTLVGCPVVVTAATLTWIVSDADANVDDDEDMQTFTVTINAGNPSVTLSTDAITVAEGGETIYTMVLTTKPVDEAIITPTVSDGVRLVTSGPLTFTTANWSTAQTVTVTSLVDRDGADDILTVTHAAVGYDATIEEVTVTVTDTDNAPDFPVPTVDRQSYTLTLDVAEFPVVLTLPEATGGNGMRTYTLAPLPLPAGLSYDPAARTLTVAAPVPVDLTLTWTVSDTDRNTGSDDANLIPIPLVVEIEPRVIVAPTALTVGEGTEGTTYTVVLTTNPGGPVTVTPTISDRTRITGPGVLNFGAANWNVVQTVTVTAVMDADTVENAVTIDHAVAGYSGVTDVAAVSVSIPDTNSVPTFGLATVDPQTYTLNTPIPTLTLPRAMAGDGTLNYTLTPRESIPAGLTLRLAAGVHTLSGMPTLVAPAVELTWTVMDRDGQPAFLRFTVLVKSDLDAAIARRSDLNRVILPEMARALADHGVDAISGRVRQASGGGAGVRRLTVGGQSTLAGALTDHGRALIEGRFDLKNVLAGSDFVLPLNAREVLPGVGVSDLSVWGSGDYRQLSGGGNAIDWEGGMFSAQLGADARLGKDLLAGVAISWGNVDLDYNYVGEGTGDYGVDLTTVYPYLGWTSLSGRLDVWATAGYGWGELEISDDEDEGDDPVTALASSDIIMKTVGAGGSVSIAERHGASIRVRGEVLQTVMDIEGSVGIASTEVEARRMRVSLEASHARSIEGWGELVPVIEVGMRHDAGDGRTGTGAEVGGRIRYIDGSNGLTVESHGRVLLGHSGGYEDWGIGGSVRLDAGGAGGRGLSFGIRPTWGSVSSRVSQVWAQEAAASVASAAGSGPRVGRIDLDIGYGLVWGGDDGVGSVGGGGILVTPYSRVSITSGLARSYRAGGRMRFGGSGVAMDLEGTRQEGADRRVDHGILLRIGLSF